MKKILFLITAILFVSSPLWATWSIVAVDPETGKVGSAGASHTPAVWPILGIAGGHGVLVAQAAGNEGLRVKAVEMLLADISAEDILEMITDREANPRLDNQQWGIVSLNGGSAGFTGSACENWTGHAGDDFVMVQGNILVSEAVVADTLAAYRSAKAGGLPLAEALVIALAAGSAAGGDKRAGDPAIAAMTAYVAVASPGDPPGHPSYAIIVPPLDNGGNPVTELERLYYETTSSLRSFFFPSMKDMIVLFIILPSAVGILLFFIIGSTTRRRMMLPGFVWVFAILGAAAFQQILQLVLEIKGWAMPVYGFWAWIYPGMIAAILIVLFTVVSLINGVIRRRAA